MTAATASLPRTVIVLGVVSLLMDLSSETIHALLPLFMVNVLGLGTVAIGLLDGGAEALTLPLKPWAGRWSDRIRRRKPLTVAGYGLSAMAKPLFAVAAGFGLIATARVLDRIGKGLRGAPRDALIADVTPPEQRGSAYGIRQALDTIGAPLAPLAAAGLLWLFAGDFRTVFWLACLPALAAVSLLWLAVTEPKPSATTPATVTSAIEYESAPPSPAKGVHQPGFITPRGTAGQAGLFTLPRPYWLVVGFAVLLTLARPSEAFLILRGQSLQLGNSLSVLLMAAMNLAYALSVWPVGHLFNRMGADKLLSLSLLLLALSQICLAAAEQAWAVYAGALLWGLHLGFSQGVLAALVSQHAPANRRAQAFGWYAMAVGTALLVNGLLFGALWQRQSPTLAFSTTALIASLSLLALPLLPAQSFRHTPAP